MGEPTREKPRVVRERPFRGVIRSDVPPRRILDLLKALHEGRLPPGSQKLSDHEGKYESYFVPLPHPPGEVLLKHFSHQRLSRFVWPVVGMSKAMHSWRIAERLREEPALTSAPVAAIERRGWGIVLDSYFLHEWIQPGVCLIEAAAERVIGGDRTTGEILEELAEVMAHLHRRGVYHSGLHAGNILEEAGEARRLLMIDLDAAGFRPKMSNADRMRMLFDAFEYFLMIGEPTDFRDFVACYARTTHIPPASLRRLTASALKRLRKKRDEMKGQTSTYREERVVKRLVWPTSRPTEIAARHVPSWDALLEKLRSRGLVCAAHRNRHAIDNSAPAEWLAAFSAAAREEEAEADRALDRLHGYAKALVNAGVRPLLLGTLPLLQRYGHPLGAGALLPFEIVIRPADMGKAADLLKEARGADVLLGDSEVFDAPEGRVRLSADRLMAGATEFDFCDLPLRIPRPECALLYYAGRSVAPAAHPRANALMDFAVFLSSSLEGMELDETVKLIRECLAEDLVWAAIRRIRVVGQSDPAGLRELARRLA
ncbi:MAG: lipopolysaccharide kinase InaA family protein [Planctomycetota bacterium]